MQKPKLYRRIRIPKNPETKVLKPSFRRSIYATIMRLGRLWGNVIGHRASRCPTTTMAFGSWTLPRRIHSTEHRTRHRPEAQCRMPHRGHMSRANSQPAGISTHKHVWEGTAALLFGEAHGFKREHLTTSWLCPASRPGPDLIPRW